LKRQPSRIQGSKYFIANSCTVEFRSSEIIEKRKIEIESRASTQPKDIKSEDCPSKGQLLAIKYLETWSRPRAALKD